LLIVVKTFKKCSAVAQVQHTKIHQRISLSVLPK